MLQVKGSSLLFWEPLPPLHTHLSTYVDTAVIHLIKWTRPILHNTVIDQKVIVGRLGSEANGCLSALCSPLRQHCV